MRTHTAPQRYAYGDRQARQYKKHKSSARAQRVYKQKSRTPGEANAIKLRREERREFTSKVNAISERAREMAQALHAEYPQHSTTKIFQDAMQFARKNATKRRVNSWNAFQSVKCEELNADKPEGEKLKIHQLTAAISAAWQKLTDEEKKSYTSERVEQITQDREEQANAPRNTALRAFHDASQNLQSIQGELTRIANRTSTHLALVAVRATTDHFMQPLVFTTSPRIDESFFIQYKETMSDFSIKLEAYSLSGMEGIGRRIHEDISILKSYCAALVKDRFNRAMHPVVARLIYQNFDANITEKYGVVVDGWPLDQFRSPSEVGSRIELETLRNALESGFVQFTKLTPEQLAQRRREQNEQRAAAAISQSVPGVTLSQPASANQEASSVPMVTDPSASTVSAPVIAQAAAVGPLAGAPSTSTLSFQSGQLVEKKARKRRSDYQTTRGPNIRTQGKPPGQRKRRNAAATATATATATAAPAPAPAPASPARDEAASGEQNAVPSSAVA